MSAPIKILIVTCLLAAAALVFVVATVLERQPSPPVPVTPPVPSAVAERTTPTPTIIVVTVIATSTPTLVPTMTPTIPPTPTNTVAPVPTATIIAGRVNNEHQAQVIVVQHHIAQNSQDVTCSFQPQFSQPGLAPQPVYFCQPMPNTIFLGQEGADVPYVAVIQATGEVVTPGSATATDGVPSDGQPVIVLSNDNPPVVTQPTTAPVVQEQPQQPVDAPVYAAPQPVDQPQPPVYEAPQPVYAAPQPADQAPVDESGCVSCQAPETYVPAPDVPSNTEPDTPTPVF